MGAWKADGLATGCPAEVRSDNGAVSAMQEGRCCVMVYAPTDPLTEPTCNIPAPPAQFNGYGVSSQGAEGCDGASKRVTGFSRSEGTVCSNPPSYPKNTMRK
jgi:hypothetical protein